MNWPVSFIMIVILLKISEIPDENHPTETEASILLADYHPHRG